jgi:hypothetical protein
MNKFKTISAITLTSTLLLGAVPVFAEGNREAKTDANITFEAGSEDSTVIPPEGTNPEVTIPPVGPEAGGALSIMYAPTINFGLQEISSRDTYYDMLAEWQTTVDAQGQPTDNKIPYVSFAQVQDRRGTNEGWELSVTASDFTSQTHNGTIIGARIHMNNSILRYEGAENNAPSIVNQNITLTPNNSQAILTAARLKGAGTSSIVWGNQDDLNKQLEDLIKEQEQEEVEEDITSKIYNNAIQLFVPGSSAIDATTYTATLTWSLVAGVPNK